MKRIWITGVNGLLGTELRKEYVRHSEWRIVGIARTLSRENSERYSAYPIDITDTAALEELLAEEPPQVIVHAAAMTNVDACEENRAECHRINYAATSMLSDMAQRVGAKFVYISTDYVFDGTSGPYRETDPVQPINCYGKAKAAAEAYIAGHHEDWLILRTTILFGYVPAYIGKVDFVRWLVNSLQQGRQVKIVADQYGNPTYVRDFVRNLYRLIDQNLTGLFHVAGDEWLSRYEFALQIAASWNLDKSLIEKIATNDLAQKAPRPLKGGFVNLKLHAEIQCGFLPLAQALDEVKNEFDNEQKINQLENNHEV